MVTGRLALASSALPMKAPRTTARNAKRKRGTCSLVATESNRSNRARNAKFGVDMARRFSNALVGGRAPVKDNRIGFEKTLARF